ncbi:MAG: asparaginase [Spirochaetia bacterium]|nr:asparaginase [Spirochaetia bacterium]
MNFLIINTGGTIVSSDHGAGLSPYSDISYGMMNCPAADLMSVDSTNMDPDFWLKISDKIRSESSSYDGFLILHGTDTMAYTASAISFILRDVEKPVVLTGASVPLGTSGGDGEGNMSCSFSVLEKMVGMNINSVVVCFSGNTVLGCRASKNSMKGNITFGMSGIAFPTDRAMYTESFRQGFDRNILSVKLFPGYRADWLEKQLDILPDVHGLVIDTFGAGGLPYKRENLLPAVRKAVSRKIPVVLTSQVPGQAVDLKLYNVGVQAMEAGAISSYDMTFETAVTKLMWLCHSFSYDDIIKLFHHSFCGEISVCARS